jgi:Tfp pilus assembly protein PilF
MQGRDTKQWRWAELRIPAGFVVLAVVLALLPGCTAGGKLKSETGGTQTTTARGIDVGSSASVKRLDDGRQGFTIKETSRMNGESRNKFERAVAMMNEGEFGGAIELLEKVIEQSPGVTAPYINLAMAYERVGKPEKAEQHLKTALTMVPQHPVASNEYGLLLRKAGRFAEARTIYEKTLATFPEYLPAHKNLGILCDLYLNDLACAMEQYEMYSVAMPGDEQVKIWIADLRRRLGP